MTTTFTPQPNGGVYAINAYGSDYVEVNGVRHVSPFVLDPESGPLALPIEITPASLGPDTLESIAAKQPEVVLIGTGSRQRFYPASTLLPLTSRRIGVETMATGPACRTFNLLAAEGRKTLLILLFDRPTTPVDSTPTKS